MRPGDRAGQLRGRAAGRRESHRRRDRLRSLCADPRAEMAQSPGDGNGADGQADPHPAGDHANAFHGRGLVYGLDRHSRGLRRFPVGYRHAAGVICSRVATAVRTLRRRLLVAHVLHVFGPEYATKHGEQLANAFDCPRSVGGGLPRQRRRVLGRSAMARRR